MDAEARLQHALAVAFRHLARRDRTAEEMRRHLAAKDVDGTVAERALATLHEQGYLDDGAYARRFAEDRRHLDGWGAERIRRRLGVLGIAPDLITAAVDEGRSVHQELEAAVALLRRRFPAPPATRRERSRALGLLVRRGYEHELACDALREHARLAA